MVDDASTDGTPDAVRGCGDPRVRLVERIGVRGLASAAIAGWDGARGELLALMDGDGQHDPALLPRLMEALEAGPVEIAIGARNLTEAQALSPLRVVLSRLGVALAGLGLGVRLTDPLSGYFVMRRSLYARVRPRLSGVGFKILVDVVASARPRPKVVELPTALRPRRGGVSKLDIRVIADLVALLVEKRLHGLVPARFILFTAVGVSGVAVNVAALGLLLRGAHLRFVVAQALAILAAMLWNFCLNNILTFRDRRLRGVGLVRGFLAFALACGLGAVFNVMVSDGLYRLHLSWAVAGVAGALLAGVFNFWAVRRITWRIRS